MGRYATIGNPPSKAARTSFYFAISFTPALFYILSISMRSMQHHNLLRADLTEIVFTSSIDISGLSSSRMEGSGSDFVRYKCGFLSHVYIERCLSQRTFRYSLYSIDVSLFCHFCVRTSALLRRLIIDQMNPTVCVTFTWSEEYR